MSRANWKTTRTLGCLLCPRATDGGPGLETEDTDAFLAHLLEAHKVDRAAVEASKGSGAMHLCGSGWSVSSAVYTLADGRQYASKATRSERVKAPKAPRKGARP